MTISVIQSAESTYASTRSPVITLSGTANENDYIVAFVSKFGASAFGAIPSGWDNPLSGTTTAQSDTACLGVVAHRVTSGEAGVTTSWTLTNLWASNSDGQVRTAVVREVDLTTPVDSINSTANATEITPHFFVSLTGSNLSTGSLVLAAVSSHGSRNYTNPSGWTEIQNGNGNASSLLSVRDTLTTSGVDVSQTNVTINSLDEHHAITVALTQAASGTNYNETGKTVDIASTTTSTDQADFEDPAAAISITATVTGTDQLGGFDELALPVSIVSTITGTDQYGHADALDVAIASTVTGTDQYGRVDDLTVSITSTVTGSDQYGRVDQLDVTVSSTLTSTDQADFEDPLTFTINASIVGTDTMAGTMEELNLPISIVATTTLSDVAAFTELAASLSAATTITATSLWGGDELARAVTITSTVLLALDVAELHDLAALVSIAAFVTGIDTVPDFADLYPIHRSHQEAAGVVYREPVAAVAYQEA